MNKLYGDHVRHHSGVENMLAKEVKKIEIMSAETIRKMVNKWNGTEKKIRQSKRKSSISKNVQQKKRGGKSSDKSSSSSDDLSYTPTSPASSETESSVVGGKSANLSTIRTRHASIDEFIAK